MQQTREVESLLLAILLAGSQQAYYTAAASLRAEDFESPAHRAIWGALGRVCERARPDAALVWRELGEDVGLVGEAGGKNFVHALASMAVYPGNLSEYVRQVQAQAEDRRLRSYLSVALERRDLSVGAVMGELSEMGVTASEGMTLKQALQRLYLDCENPSTATIAYPWGPVQSLTGGLHPGWLCYLAGETSHGKSAAALELSDSVLDTGKRVLYVSLEMADSDIALRIAQRYHLSGGRVIHRKTSEEDFAVLSALIAQERTERMRLEFAERVEQLPGLVMRHKPDLLVVDYLGLLDIGKQTRLEGTTRNSRSLKLLARRYELPVVCLHQLSRARPEEENKLPRLRRLRDSGQLENDADQVIFVWRKRDENQVLMREGAMAVAKCRHGETGNARMAFDGVTQTFDVSFGPTP